MNTAVVQTLSVTELWRQLTEYSA